MLLTNPTLPEGFKEVSKEVFYKMVNDAAMFDPMPSWFDQPPCPKHTQTWTYCKGSKSGQVFGYTWQKNYDFTSTSVGYAVKVQ